MWACYEHYTTWHYMIHIRSKLGIWKVGGDGIRKDKNQKLPQSLTCRIYSHTCRLYGVQVGAMWQFRLLLPNVGGSIRAKWSLTSEPDADTLLGLNASRQFKKEMPETLVSWCLHTMFTSSKHSKTKKSTRQDHYEVDFFVAIGPEIVLNKLELLQKGIKLMNPAHSCTFLHNMHPIPHCQQKIHRKPPWNLMGFQQPGPVELSSKHWKFGNMEQPKHKETQDIETNKQLGIWTKTYAYKNKIN